jgi:prepilin-type N-terminal cleavage/methylation domain-containing protein
MKMRKGFTLIEMLVVVAIIVALLTIIGFAGPALTKGAKINAAKGTVKNMATALNVVLQNTGAAPADAAAATIAMAPYLSGSTVNPFNPAGVLKLGTPLTDPMGNTDGIFTYTPSTVTVDGVSVPKFVISYTIGGQSGTYTSGNYN